MERFSNALKSSLGIKPSKSEEKDYLVTKEQLQGGDGFGGKTMYVLYLHYNLSLNLQ
jgi:hypothetical protein